MKHGDGSDEATDTKGLSQTGFTLETWKAGWTLMDQGSFSLTAARLMIFLISKATDEPGS